MSKVIDFNKYKKNQEVQNNLVYRERKPLYVSHKITDGKNDGKNYADRIFEVKQRLETIDKLINLLGKYKKIDKGDKNV